MTELKCWLKTTRIVGDKQCKRKTKINNFNSPSLLDGVLVSFQKQTTIRQQFINVTLLFGNPGQNGKTFSNFSL